MFLMSRNTCKPQHSLYDWA